MGLPPPPPRESEVEKTARFTRHLVQGIVIVIAIVVIVVIAGFAYNTYTSNSNITQVQIKVQYSGSWSGAYGGGSIANVQSWSGTGTQTVILDKSSSPWVVVAGAAKADGSSGTLTISILKMDGTVLATSSTSTPYALTTVSYNFGH